MSHSIDDHITRLLHELHLLSLEHRITFKLLLITLKALNNLAPCYISNLLHMYTLNSLSSVMKSENVWNGAPKLWNSLPSYIKSSSSASTFKSPLKTHIFRQCFIS